MPRIPNDLLERIKQETPLRTLVERSGVGLKVSGENLIGLCPLHEDHDPRSRGSRALLGRQRLRGRKTRTFGAVPRGGSTGR